MLKEYIVIMKQDHASFFLPHALSCRKKFGFLATDAPLMQDRSFRASRQVYSSMELDLRM